MKILSCSPEISKRRRPRRPESPVVARRPNTGVSLETSSSFPRSRWSCDRSPTFKNGVRRPDVFCYIFFEDGNYGNVFFQKRAFGVRRPDIFAISLAHTSCKTITFQKWTFDVGSPHNFAAGSVHILSKTADGNDFSKTSVWRETS